MFVLLFFFFFFFLASINDIRTARLLKEFFHCNFTEGIENSESPNKARLPRGELFSPVTWTLGWPFFFYRILLRPLIS